MKKVYPASFKCELTNEFQSTLRRVHQTVAHELFVHFKTKKTTTFFKSNLILNPNQMHINTKSNYHFVRKLI